MSRIGLGGPKKPTMTQASKEKAPEKKEAPAEKSVLGLSLPDGGEVISFVRGSKYVTPFLLAERFGVRLSVARKVLAELAARGVVRQVVGSNRLRIFQPSAPSEQKVEEAKPKPTKARVKKAAGDKVSASPPD